MNLGLNYILDHTLICTSESMAATFIRIINRSRHVSKMCAYKKCNASFGLGHWVLVEWCTTQTTETKLGTEYSTEGVS